MSEEKQNSFSKELLDAEELLNKLEIKKNMVIADLGCGPKGHFTFPAARLVGDNGLVYAVDVVQNVLAGVDNLAQVYGLPNVRTLWADLEVPGAVKVRDGSVDIALLNNILFQTEKDDVVFQQAVRLLKEGGRLLITIWKKDGAAFGPPQEKRIDQTEVKKFARQAGLKLEEEFAAGKYYHGLIFHK